MKLITGLGNPGDRYTNTRHNAGFLLLDILREKFLYQKGIEVTEWEEESMFKSEFSFIKEGSRIIAILQKPQTYMNRSGEAVAKVVNKFDIENLEQNLILIHDDLDIPLGKYKIQQGKSPLGHNGVKDVEDRLGFCDFKRVRIGVENREGKNISGEDFVLMKMLPEEKLLLAETVEEAIGGILSDILM